MEKDKFDEILLTIFFILGSLFFFLGCVFMITFILVEL